MNTDNQPGTRAFLSENGRMMAGPPDAASLVEPTAPVKKKAVAAKPKATMPSNTRKAAQQPLGSSRAASKAEKLVCRYCAATISRRPSGRDEMPAAALASRNATVRPRGARGPHALGRRRPRSS